VEHSSSELGYRAFQRQRFETLVRRCGVPEAARRELVELVERERDTRVFTVFDGAVDALARLRAHGLTIGICSNWDWDLERRLRFNEIDGLVDFVVCSAIVGYRKPHPAIFDRVVADAGVPADQILFVGDTWTDEIGCASDAGMDVMHVSTGVGCAGLDHGSVPCADSLGAVVDHVLGPGGQG